MKVIVITDAGFDLGKRPILALATLELPEFVTPEPLGTLATDHHHVQTLRELLGLPVEVVKAKGGLPTTS